MANLDKTQPWGSSDAVPEGVGVASRSGGGGASAEPEPSTWSPFQREQARPSVRVRRRVAVWVGRGAVLLLVGAGATYLLLDHLIVFGLTLWMAGREHRTIEIDAYDRHGAALRGAAFLRQWQPMLVVRDGRGSPVFGLPYGLGTPRIGIESDEPVHLELLWEIPGFGKVLVEANNQGQGYRPPADRPLRLELGPELARSHLWLVRDWVERRRAGGFASREAAADVAAAANAIARMDAAAEPSERAVLALDALRLSHRAGEAEVLAEARDVIRTTRRGAVRVAVVDDSGAPLPDVEVAVRQRRADFLFGVYSDGYDDVAMRQLRELGLNYAILFMTWDRTEPRRGAFTLEPFDRFLARPEVAGGDIRTCAHALLWLADGEVPPYVADLHGRPDQLVEAVRAHVGPIVDRFKGRIDLWEAINEGHPQWSRWGLDDAELARVAKASAEEIRRRDPDTPIMVEVTLPLAEDVALKHYPLMDLVSMGRVGDAAIDPYLYLEQLAAAGVPHDVIGLQIYNGGWMNIAWGVQVPAIDLFRLARVIERYARLGKPIQIAEIAVGSTAYRGAGASWWHGPADETTQADYLAGVFTLAYGTPQVSGINWWGLDDAYRFVEAGGIFDAAGRPKAAAHRLRALLEEWNAPGRLRTDADGVATFDGSAGDYVVSAAAEAGNARAAIHIAAGQTTDLTLRVSMQ